MEFLISILACTVPALEGAPQFPIDRWHVDARFSTVGFDAESTLHDFTGKTHAITGEIRFESTPTTTRAGGAVWVEARTLDTGNESRDEDMRAALDTKAHPEIVFELESVVGVLVEGGGSFTGRGRFLVHGRERRKDVTFRVEPVEGGTLRVVGDARLKLSEHGVDPPGFLFVSVDDDVRVWFDLRLARVPAQRLAARAFEASVVRHARVEGRDVAAAPVQERVWIAGQDVLWDAALGRDWSARVGGALQAFDPFTLEVWWSGDVSAWSAENEPRPAPGPSGAIEFERAGYRFRSDRPSGAEPLAPFAVLVAPRFRAPLALAHDLRAARGVLARLELRTPDADGAWHEVTLRPIDSEEARVPEWAFRPDTWLVPPSTARRAATRTPR